MMIDDRSLGTKGPVSQLRSFVRRYRSVACCCVRFVARNTQAQLRPCGCGCGCGCVLSLRFLACALRCAPRPRTPLAGVRPLLRHARIRTTQNASAVCSAAADVGTGERPTRQQRIKKSVSTSPHLTSRASRAFRGLTAPRTNERHIPIAWRTTGRVNAAAVHSRLYQRPRWGYSPAAAWACALSLVQSVAGALNKCCDQ